MSDVNYNDTTSKAATAGSGATTSLNNLASTAVNVKIVPATTNSIDLGDLDAEKIWNNVFAQDVWATQRLHADKFSAITSVIALGSSLVAEVAGTVDIGASGAEFDNGYIDHIFSSGNCGAEVIDVLNGTLNDADATASVNFSGRQLKDGSVVTLDWNNGRVSVPVTITAGATTGNQTINNISGTVNFAAAATTITVTNDKVGTDSIVFAVVRTNDATSTIKNVTCTSGAFTIRLTAGATAETSVGFFVLNGI